MVRYLSAEETAVLRLRKLYETHGYKRYRMSGFEEYDIYALNKDFLGGEAVITFTDTVGRLMALKPDVTMSIIRSLSDEENANPTERLYYDEKVCRISRKSRRPKEILQSGIECIGDIDLFSTCEVISLAAEAIGIFSERFVIDISHMGIVTEILSESGASELLKKEIIRLMASKNVHELKRLLEQSEIENSVSERILKILRLDGAFEDSLSELSKICKSGASRSALSELIQLESALNSQRYFNRFRLDFSLVQDMTYYNGIVFQGFIDGVPEKVLSGGRYDPLPKRFGSDKNAIGFAVDMQSLEQLFDDDNSACGDIALMYSPSDAAASVLLEAGRLRRDGSRVLATKTASEADGFKKIIYFDGEGR